MMVNTGGTVTLVMELEANANIATVTPTAPTFTVTGGASATCGSPHTPASQAMTAGVKATSPGHAPSPPARFRARCTSPPGPPAPAAPTSTTPTSNTVIAIKPLTFQGTVSNPVSPTGLTLIENYASISDSGVIPSTPSNTTQTALGKSIGDFVWADLDGDGMQDAGEPGIRRRQGLHRCQQQRRLRPGEQSTTTNSHGILRAGRADCGHLQGHLRSEHRAGLRPHHADVRERDAEPPAMQYKDTADFGLQPPGQYSIGDTVWLDSDNSGSPERHGAGPVRRHRQAVR